MNFNKNFPPAPAKGVPPPFNRQAGNARQFKPVVAQLKSLQRKAVQLPPPTLRALQTKSANIRSSVAQRREIKVRISDYIDQITAERREDPNAASREVSSFLHREERAQRQAELQVRQQVEREEQARRVLQEEWRRQREFEGDCRHIHQRVLTMNWSGNHGGTEYVDGRLGAFHDWAMKKYHNKPFTSSHGFKLFYYVGKLDAPGEPGFRISGHNKVLTPAEKKAGKKTKTFGVLHILRN